MVDCIFVHISLCFSIQIGMADQHSGEGSSTSNMESSDATVQIKIKTLDSQIYNFQVDKNVSTGFICLSSIYCEIIIIVIIIVHINDLTLMIVLIYAMFKM